MTTKKLFCYRDGTGADRFAVSDAQSPAEFLAANPGCDLLYMFDTKDDMIVAESIERNRFISMAAMYGFSPADYGKEFRIPATGHLYRLVGINPANTRYKAICLDLDKGTRVKMPVATALMNIKAQNAP